MASLTAARLIHFDEKCGNGSISKGEKCTKGRGVYAGSSGTNGNGTGIPGNRNYGSYKSNIMKNAIPAALTFGAIGAARGGIKGAQMGRAIWGRGGGLPGGIIGATSGGLANAAVWGAVGAGAGAITAAIQRNNIKSINSAYRKKNSKALKEGAMKAVSMKKENKRVFADV